MSDIPLPAWASDPAPTTSDIPIPDWAGGPKGKPKSAAAPSQAIGAPGAEVVDDKALAQEAGKDLLSIADLGASLPAAAIGVAGDVNTRLGAGLAGESHKTISRAGNLAFEEAMQRYGSPFHKLLQAAGLGKVDDGPEGAVDSLMAKATSLLGRGGDAIEKATGGAVNADDVNSMVNFLMTLGGGKGLEAGIRKFAARAPDSVLGVAKAGPEAEKAQAQRAARDSDDPTAGTKFAEGQAAAATKAKTRMTEGKELVFDPATGELGEAVPLPGKEIPKPTTRDRALEKVAGGRSWDMTAEERIAYNAFNREGAPKPIVDAQGNVIDKAAFAGTKAGKGMSRQRGMVDLSPLPDDAPLKVILDKMTSTLKTFERLQPGAKEFSKQTLTQALRQQDISKGEKGILEPIVAEIPEGGKITAKALLQKASVGMGNFELTKQTTDEFAGYGLEEIDREEPPNGDWQNPAAETHVWQLPIHMPQSDANHFSDPRYFGHTRTFEEDGVRHVVEIQSDLAQKAAKAVNLSTEERTQLRSDMETAQRTLDGLKKGETVAMYTGNDEWPAAFRRDWEKFPAPLRERLNLLAEEYYGKEVPELDLSKRETRNWLNGMVGAGQERLETLIREKDSALRASVDGLPRLEPMLKNWPRRLIREELADAARAGGQPDPKLVARLAEIRARMAKGYHEGSFQKGNDLAEAKEIEKKLAKGAEKVVRFATADTVAKVEGWPKKDPAADARSEYEQARHRYESIIDMTSGAAGGGEHFSARVDQLRRAVDEAYAELEAAEKEAGPPRFSPEHQSIYDRYRRDIEPYLKSLGGTPHTDSGGHTWIEVPLRPEWKRAAQMGGVSSDMMARLATMGLGAWAGVHFSDSKDLKAALLGGLAGTMIPLIHPIALARFAREALGKQAPRFSIADPARSWDSYRRLWQIDTVLLQDKLDAILPDEADRTAVLHAREAGPAAVAALSPKQREYAKLLGEAFDERLWTGIDNEVLESARDNYVTHMWDWGKNDKGLLERFLSSHGIGMSPSTPYAKERTIPTYAEGKALGLTPISEDPTYILGAYSNSLINAISTKNLIDALKGHEVLTSSGAKLQLAMPADKAPREYVSINHQALRGFKVHPDIEGQMKLLFDTAPAGDWMKVATMISDTAKHMGVSLSLFHAKSLVEAAVRASNHPLRLVGSLPSIITGEHEFLREIQKGSASPLVEDAVNDGVMFSVKGVGSEDAGGAFYSVMKAAADFADSKIPHAGLPFKGFAAINRKLDRMLWERLHPALKLIIYSEKRAALLENSIREGKRTGKPSLSKAEAGRIAASFTNDLEGSLNYPRIAMEAQTQFGRLAAEKAFTPAGRRGLQVAFFAPDWNIAAIRMVANAFRPEGSVRGVLSPRTLADLHRNLILRSALFYFIAFDAINHALSGHHIWQNKDWTKVDMDAKGQRHLQIDKGMMEVPNMIRQPRQEALNKLGFIPSESLNQLMDTEYLSPRTDPRTGQAMAGPPMKGGRVAHAAGRLLPFASHQSPTAGPVEEALTRSGIIQITGSTAETRGEEKRAREAAKRQRELDARRSRHP